MMNPLDFLPAIFSEAKAKPDPTTLAAEALLEARKKAAAKPTIKSIGARCSAGRMPGPPRDVRMWACFSSGSFAIGHGLTPREAYINWLAVRGRAQP